MKPFLFLALVATSLHAADWPRFLGPKGTGVSDETEWNTDWAKSEPKELWSAKVGIGCSSISIANGLAYTVGQPRGKKETVWCFDAVSGAVKWTFEYKHELEPLYYSGGPSATPCIDAGKLYTLSRDGELRCLDAATGAALWEKSFTKDYGGREPKWGYASSPFTVGDSLIIEPGGKGASLVALNKETGAELWRAGDDATAYATPTICEWPAGTPALASFNQFGLVGRDLQGKELFRSAWKTDNDVNATSPMPWADGFLVSSAYGHGAAFLRVAEGRVTPVWESDVLMLQFQNIIVIDGHAFAVNGENTTRATFRRVDIATGKLQYEHKISGNRGSIIHVGGKLLVLTDAGELILAEPSAAKYTELQSMQVNRKTCWAPPAFANGLLYTRNNDGALVCLDMRK